MNKIRIAWILSLIATLGSLYFSEVRGFIPCSLCWYQRILMYPMVFILGVAVYKNNDKIVPYLLPLPLIGAPLALFHYLKQKVPFFAEVGSCGTGVPCSAEYINWLGFITIPFLSLAAFSIILTLFLMKLREDKKQDQE